jgi:exosortase
MSSVASTAHSPAAERPAPEPGIPWINIGWFSVLLIICYLPTLVYLVDRWYNDEDMGHGFFVPVIALYIAWLNKDRLMEADLNPSYAWGSGVLVFAALQYYLATLGAELFLARTAFIESVIGVVLFLGGWKAVKILAFPLFLLFFMVPIPAIIYNSATLRLQMLASSCAEWALALIGIPVFREGNVLELASQKLSVVEACSGIRSLLSLTFLSLVYSYFFDKRTWMRVVLFLATIPIAIIANAGRVTLTGILSEIRPSLAHGFMHTMSGWVIFMIALFILIALHQLISRIYDAMHAEDRDVATA